MNPKYPVFIPSKGRWKTRLTAKAFEKMQIPYQIVVEPQEYDNYSKVVDSKKIIVLPFSDRGLVETRNWIWDYVQKSGYERFWTFDDNIREIYRFNKNMKNRVFSAAPLCVAEDFVGRYENIAIMGFQYEMFIPRKRKSPPFLINTRVYSNMCIKTDIPYRNRDIYNDDTDLCLRVLKDGWCTILFYSFLVKKIAMMKMEGGMTPHYQDGGRLKMAQSLQRQHPDVTKIVWKWNRWQHQVDYRPFKKNKLILKKGIDIPKGINNYGMVLRKQNEPSIQTLPDTESSYLSDGISQTI